MMKKQIICDLKKYCKSVFDHKLGIEYELFVLHKQTNLPPPYSLLREVFLRLVNNSNNYQLIYDESYDSDYIIGIKGPSFVLGLEPGCQIEISLLPYSKLDQINEEMEKILQLVKDMLPEYNLYAQGYNSFQKIESIPLFQKTRYQIMYKHMFSNYVLGHAMMKTTCSLQFNLDYSSEVDAYQKFLTSLVIQPVLLAIFANSPWHIEDSRIAGKNVWVDYRSYIWQYMDKSRAGVPNFIFDCKPDNFFSSYVDYNYKLPLMFLLRNHKFIVINNQYSFADFVDGKMACDIKLKKFCPLIYANGQSISNISAMEIIKNIDLTPTLDDWYLHVNTIFTETRLQKGYLELRSIDSCHWDYYGKALADFWIQFMHSPNLLSYFLKTFESMNFHDVCHLYYQAASVGLKDSVLQNIAQLMINLLEKNSTAALIFREVASKGINKLIL